MLEATPAYLLRNLVYGEVILKSYFIGFSSASIFVLLFRKVFLIRGAPALDYISGVLAFLLDDRRDWIKDLADQLDDRSSVQVDILMFRRKAAPPEVAILVPTFHPGPFKDFGSSGLPYKISEELNRLGVKTIFFKGLSNHHDNLIFEEDCKLIIESIKAVLLERSSSKLSYSPNACAPVSLVVDHVKGTVLPVGEVKLLFITTHPRGMEDIPGELMKEVRDCSLIPVDCHNSFSESVKDLDEGSISSISNLMKKAEELELGDSLPLIFGYSQATLEGYSREAGIGDLGLSAAVFMLEGHPTAIISLDGNNCFPEVREKIIEKLKPLGFKFIEVLTTDTHIVNGLSFGGRGYHPLGEVISAEVLAEKAFEIVKSAMKAAKPMEVAWTRLKFFGVKVMSPAFLEEAAARTRQGIATFFLFLIASAVLGVFL